MANTKTLLTGIILVLLMVILAGLFLAPLNSTYDEEYGLGLDTGGLDDISSQFERSYNDTIGGEVESKDDGLSLLSSWNIALGLFKLTWEFVNGSWINNLFMNVLDLGETGFYLALVLRLLFIATLIFSVIKLFFKVVL